VSLKRQDGERDRPGEHHRQRRAASV
jgi:hypothetical protein